MQEVPNSCGFLAFSPVRDAVLAFVNGLYYFVLIFNGSDLFAVAGRDIDATTGRLLPIDAACELIAEPLWTNYASAKAADPGFRGPSGPSYRVYWIPPCL